MLCRIKDRIPVLITRQVATLTRHQPIRTIQLALALVVAALVLAPAVEPVRVPVVVLVVLAPVRVVQAPVAPAARARAPAVNYISAEKAGLVPAFFLVHRAFPGKAALIFRKKYSESRKP